MRPETWSSLVFRKWNGSEGGHMTWTVNRMELFGLHGVPKSVVLHRVCKKCCTSGSTESSLNYTELNSSLHPCGAPIKSLRQSVRLCVHMQQLQNGSTDCH
jgi:hypothetical protein